MLLNAFRPNDPAFTTHTLEGGEGIDGRRQPQARSAPLGPEIDQYRLVAADDLGIEIGIGQFKDGIACHGWFS